MANDYEVAGTTVFDSSGKVAWSLLTGTPSPLVTTLSSGLRDTSGTGGIIAVGFRQIELPTTTSIRLHTQFALSDCNCNNSACSCFPAGTRILLPDATQKLVEHIRVGDEVMGMDGPVRVAEVFHTKLLDQPLYGFADGSLKWKGGHTFWVRRHIPADVGLGVGLIKERTAQWVWSRRPDLWRLDVEAGIVPGLKDNFNLWANVLEPCIEEFAHLGGFVKRQVIEFGASPELPIYSFHTEDGSLVFANGYMVGAGINERRFNYLTYAWQGEPKWLAIAL